MLLVWTAVRFLTAGVLAGTLQSAPGRRRASAPTDAATAALAAQVDRIDPTLARDLRWVSRSVVAVVGVLEGLLERFRDLEARLDRARCQVEDGRGTEVDDELFNRLAQRLELWPVREALQRLQDAHPDAPGDDLDHDD
jgi:hypothetical protein